MVFACPDNPTTELIKALPNYLAVELADLPPTTLRVASCTVLETSKNCVPTVAALHATPPAGGDATQVFIHFGVAARSKHIRLEDRAFNIANFRVPDESGWQPCNEPILCSISQEVR